MDGHEDWQWAAPRSPWPPKIPNEGLQRQERQPAFFDVVPVDEDGQLKAIYRSKGYKAKNTHLIFRPGNRYEIWLPHGAIPFVFKDFICSNKYVSRGELALYIRLTLLMDQYEVCYPTYDELADGVFKLTKQILPVMNGLINKHLIMRSHKQVTIPWLAKTALPRYIYQRPSVLYTIGRLHYVGFTDSRSKKDTFMDVETFDRSIVLLLGAIRNRAERSLYNPEQDLTMPDIENLTELTLKQYLVKSVLTSQELKRVSLDERFNNRKASLDFRDE